jgi:hypothetical protein
MLQFLQQNHGSLTPQQQGLLAQLQHQYRSMQQHQQQLRLQQQQASQRGLRPGQPGYPMGYAPAHAQPGQPGVIKSYGMPQQPVRAPISLLPLTLPFRPPCKPFDKSSRVPISRQTNFLILLFLRSTLPLFLSRKNFKIKSCPVFT